MMMIHLQFSFMPQIQKISYSILSNSAYGRNAHEQHIEYCRVCVPVQSTIAHTFINCHLHFLPLIVVHDAECESYAQQKYTTQELLSVLKHDDDDDSDNENDKLPHLSV